MFRLEIFVEDKLLGEALKRLSGIARNVQHNYVPNVEPKANGKLRLTAQDSMELLVKEMKKRKLTEVEAKQAREIVVSMGMSPTSYSHVLNQAVTKGLMTKRHHHPGSVAMVYALKPPKAEK